MQVRAVTLLEITVVVAVSAVLAAGVLTSLSGRQKESMGLDALLSVIADQRASHVAAGRTEYLALCGDCFDDNGAAQAPQTPTLLDIALVPATGPFDSGRMVLSQEIEGAGFRVVGAGPIVLDALGRSVELQTGTLQGVDRRIDVTLPTGRRESITLTGDGRLLSSFAAARPTLPPHAQNLSSRTTPTPMPRGGFTGDATRATAVRLE